MQRRGKVYLDSEKAIATYSTLLYLCHMRFFFFISGFLFLQKLFIMKGRQEITWTALRKFGYGNDLELREEYVRPRFVHLYFVSYQNA